MAGKILGKVVSIRDSGDLVTDITSAQLEGVPRDDQVVVACDGHSTTGIFPADHDQPALTLLAVLGGDDVLELTLVGESARAFLGIGSGAEVVVKW